MKKRQIKKNLNRHVRLYIDELPLLLMSQEEVIAAYKDRDEYRNKIARLPYRRIKNFKAMYYFPVSKSQQWYSTVNDMSKPRKSSGIVH